MRQSNNVIEFIFLSLTPDPTGHKELFTMFLLMYIVTVVGNLLIVVTIIASSSLSSLMYFFLAFLSLLDAVYSTAFFPKLLKDLVCEKKDHFLHSLSVYLFVGHLFCGSEAFLMVVMVYDRYVALHYLTITNTNRQVYISVLVVA